MSAIRFHTRKLDTISLTRHKETDVPFLMGRYQLLNNTNIFGWQCHLLILLRYNTLCIVLSYEKDFYQQLTCMLNYNKERNSKLKTLFIISFLYWSPLATVCKIINRHILPLLGRFTEELHFLITLNFAKLL